MQILRTRDVFLHSQWLNRGGEANESWVCAAGHWGELSIFSCMGKACDYFFPSHMYADQENSSITGQTRGKRCM